MAPSPRLQALMVWTGRELIVFGGRDEYNKLSLPNGGVYDVEKKKWRAMTPPPHSVQDSTFKNSTAFWTGSQLVVLVGERTLFYDPVYDEWTENGVPVGPALGMYSRFFWTGFEGLLWNLEERVGSIFYP